MKEQTPEMPSHITPYKEHFTFLTVRVREIRMEKDCQVHRPSSYPMTSQRRLRRSPSPFPLCLHSLLGKHREEPQRPGTHSLNLPQSAPLHLFTMFFMVVSWMVYYDDYVFMVGRKIYVIRGFILVL